jgi:GT2 family glycosyltransferase
MTHAPKVAIVILNWNGVHDTVQCLESVSQIDYPNYEIVLVDNGSTDNSVATVRGRFPLATVIENGRNLGFAEGNNRGIRYGLKSRAEFVLLLNNDTTVGRSMLREFIEATRTYPNAGVFSAKIYFFHDPQRLHYAGADWSPELAGFVFRGMYEIDDGERWQRIRPTDLASGCALLARASVFREVGLLDPRFFLIWEEADWCCRARAAGYNCVFVPRARVWHKISRSFADGRKGVHATYYFWRNRLLWIERNLGWRQGIAAFYRVIGPQLMAHIDLLRAGNTNFRQRLMARTALYAVMHYFLRRFGPAPSWMVRAAARSARNTGPEREIRSRRVMELLKRHREKLTA